MDLTRAQLLLNLDIGPTPEPPVDSELFLRSFLSFSVWARVLEAHRVVHWAAEPQCSPASQLAAGSAFYQLVGLLFEDAVGTLAAWTCWAADRSLPLAAVAGLLNLKRDGRPLSSIAEFQAKSTTVMRQSRRVSLDPVSFLSLLARQSEEELILGLGLRTTTVRRHTETEAAKGLVQMLSQESAQYLTPIYNKLKHGPQIVVMSMQDGASGRGLTLPAEVPGEHIRLLFDGARTQSEPNEPPATRIAPFLLHEPYFLRKVLFEVLMPISAVLFQLGASLYEDVYSLEAPKMSDPAVRAVFLEMLELKGGAKTNAFPN